MPNRACASRSMPSWLRSRSPCLTTQANGGQGSLTPAPAVADVVAGTETERAGCVNLIPSSGAVTSAVVTLPRAGVEIRDAGAGAAALALRRFGEAFDQIPSTIASHSEVASSIPSDASAVPWQLQLSASSPMSICGIPRTGLAAALMSTMRVRLIGASLAGHVSPGRVLTLTLVCFALLSAGVLSLTPPWEANDEPDHVRNIEVLASGHWYRITPESGFEPQQAPLYYLLLAAYQKLTRLPVRLPDGQLGPVADNQQHGNYLHNVSQDGEDQRWLDLLRLPSIVFGAARDLPDICCCETYLSRSVCWQSLQRSSREFQASDFCRRWSTMTICPTSLGPRGWHWCSPCWLPGRRLDVVDSLARSRSA